METSFKLEKRQVILPRKRIHKTPRLLYADAYTLGADEFQSESAKEKSVYYITFRRNLYKINQDLYTKGDDRIVFIGLPRILEKLFYEPITHEEIDETKRFLEHAKVTSKGFKKYKFPEHLWREVVDKFNGRPPISIKALSEGSVCYPNEPVVVIESLVDGFGELAAWFESKLLQVWASTERVTQDRHWFKKMCEMVRKVDSSLDDATVKFYASLMLHDFGDRAGICQEESEELGMYHFLTWGGSDTFSGGYQAWKNSNEAIGICSSVNALAHRNVQAFEFEGDCYKEIYEKCDNDEFISMVADCYDFFYAVENFLLPLALRSINENNGKVVVARPDSGDALEQVLFVCELAVKHGLYTEKVINGKTWKFSTTLKFIEGDGMDFGTMSKIIDALLERGFVPYSWGLFGVGGGLRNGLKRDNLSAKYALSARGNDLVPVVKFSETMGKTTLPGVLSVVRTPEALQTKTTIRFSTQCDEKDNKLIEHYNGTNLYKPFGDIMDENFLDVKERINLEFDSIPLTLETEENHNYPASREVLDLRLKLLEKYAPTKNKNNY